MQKKNYFLAKTRFFISWNNLFSTITIIIVEIIVRSSEIKTERGTIYMQQTDCELSLYKRIRTLKSKS